MKNVKLLSILFFVFALISSVSARDKSGENKKTAQSVYTDIKKMETLDEQKVRTALTGLSSSEKVKLVKLTLNDIKANQNASTAEYILAIFIPPLAVGLHTNWAVTPLVINIILTLLFFLPGIIHAFIVLGS